MIDSAERDALIREDRLRRRYDYVDDGECLCRWDRGDFYQPPAFEENPECPLHGEDA